MVALVGGLALLPQVLRLGEEGVGEGVAKVSAGVAIACAGAWARLTGAQVRFWVAHAAGCGGGSGGGGNGLDAHEMAAQGKGVAEDNVRDVVGWACSELLPAAIASTSQHEGISSAPPLILGCIAGLAADCCTIGLALTHSHSLLNAVTEDADVLQWVVGEEENGGGVSPALPSLLRLVLRLISAACEGLTPGSLPLLPSDAHAPLLRAAGSLLKAAPAAIAAPAAAALVERLLRLRRPWGEARAASALRALLCALRGEEGGDMWAAAVGAAGREPWAKSVAEEMRV